LLCAALLVACSDEDAASEPPSDVAPADVDAGADLADAPGAVDEGASPIGDEGAPPAPTTPRRWTYRALGGMSMGAASGNMALHHPDLFDIVGALGGYIDLQYFAQTAFLLQLGGFCPPEKLSGRLAEINDNNADPPVTCAPDVDLYEHEFLQDYNHLHYDDNGADMHREFYLEVYQNFINVLGNLSADPGDPDSYLPAGVDLEWHLSTPPKERCADPKPVTGAFAFNAEHNPDGVHQVIPFCDSSKQVTPGLAPGDFDPAVEHEFPVDILLSVDLNGNGKRDYGEPIMLNAQERFTDHGEDGCPNPREDGAGGCLDEGEADSSEQDPNGDDYHWWDNPTGTEANRVYDEGEAFEDLGLDGVPAERTGSPDPAEGNGRFDQVGALDRAADLTASRLLRQLPDGALDRLDLYFDAGIRDALHAAVSTRRVVGALRSLGAEVRVYGGFAGAPESLLPDATDDNAATTLLGSDLSAAAIGRHVYVEYGKPDASPEEIDEGDGKHVGTITDALNRLAAYSVLALQRMPKPDLDPIESFKVPTATWHHYYSEGLKARRGYTMILPPGYSDPEQAEKRYPVLYFMHGLGQTAQDLAPAGILFAPMMARGTVPKAIIAFPDGACCYVHVPTGRRECACQDGGDGVKSCVDPTCTGDDEEACELRDIPNGELVRECAKGSLYYNLLTNRWGERRADMRYEQSVLDLIAHVDRSYRTREAEEIRQ